MRRREALATLGVLSTGGCLRLTGGGDETTRTAGQSDGGGSETTRTAGQSDDGGGEATRTAGQSDDGGAGETDDTGGTETSDVDIWVAPDGSGGDGSRSSPFTSVREAFGAVEPGETVFLQSGEYRLNGVTQGGGEPGAPVEITGPRDAILRARDRTGSVLDIVHSHVHLTGTTVDGLIDPGRRWETPDAWIDTLIGVSPGPRYEQDGVDYLEDVVVEPHAMRNSGSLFVQLERTRDASIGNFEVTGPAGAEFHPEMTDPVESHVGHLIEIGASTKTIAEYKPWDGIDRTRNVRIHHVDNSAGYHHSSFANVWLGAEAVTVEYCTDRNAGNETTGKETVAAVKLGANNCTIRGNDFADARQGIEFGAWTPKDVADATNWARNNDVYANRIQRLSRAPFLFSDTSPSAQRTFCDNRLVGIEGNYDYATGECPTDVPPVDGIGHTAGRSEE